MPLTPLAALVIARANNGQCAQNQNRSDHQKVDTTEGHGDAVIPGLGPAAWFTRLMAESTIAVGSVVDGSR